MQSKCILFKMYRGAIYILYKGEIRTNDIFLILEDLRGKYISSR